MFLFIPKILEQNQNFLMCSNFFLAKAKRYYLIQKLRNKTKTFWFSLQISKNKTELFVVSKKIWKLNKSIAFGPKILRSERECFGSIMNFVSKTDVFDFFGNVSRKTKANDLEKTLVWHYYYPARWIRPKLGSFERPFLKREGSRFRKIPPVFILWKPSSLKSLRFKARLPILRRVHIAIDNIEEGSLRHCEYRRAFIVPLPKEKILGLKCIGIALRHYKQIPKIRVYSERHCQQLYVVQ